MGFRDVRGAQVSQIAGLGALPQFIKKTNLFVTTFIVNRAFNLPNRNEQGEYCEK